MKVLVTLNLVCSGVLAAFPVSAAITVDINGQTVQFDANPRLAEVLAPVALQQSWYWPAAALYKKNGDTAEQQRLQVLQMVNALKQHYAADMDLLNALQSVERQVGSWTLAERIVMPVDYDLARILPQHNPRLTDGHYLLQLTKRPQNIYVFGAVDYADAIVHRGAATVAEYISAAKLASAADTEQISIVQPDGTIQSAGTEYWNQTHTEAMPGAQLFIPFKTALFNSQLDELNKRLPELAIHRVLP
ncbi:capsule biosynthesis GfcC family protein [Rheinheimera aquimaris]|uniref:capsule biosynthesis GfcC family protein n=1 Tax=Rheinheimera aquimaris TaxID=412437 RepID=UPI000E9DE6E5|nr:hypothetical protein [Rheinheimera sp.]